MTLYKRYHKYALGGTQDPDNKFGNASAAVAGIGTGLIDAIDTPNEYGHQSAVGTIGKSTLQMGALGAEVGGPLGAGIGAGLGLVSGFLKSRSNSNAENITRNRMIQSRNTMDRNNSMARIATNPSLVAGYRDAQMFATGGSLRSSSMTPAQVSPNTENDSLPTYLNYIKSVQNNNADGATASLNHIRDTRGPGMVTRMQFLGKSLGTTNINDIARRGVGGEADPQMKLLYSTINENPDVINKFQYGTEMVNRDLVKHAAGGTIKAPLTAAYMTGGKAVSTSSGTTEIEGNSHDEGGVKAPQLGAELEDGETTSGNFVFSKELGFAKLHAPIAKAKGIIEKKPQTGERIAAIKLLNAQENKLALSQEYLKKQLGIQ